MKNIHPRPPRIILISIFIFILFAAPAANADSCGDMITEAKQFFCNHLAIESGVAKSEVAFLKIAENNECAYEAFWRLSDMYICLGTRAKSDDEKKTLFTKGMDYALKSIEANPKGREGHFFYGVNLGSWIQTDGVAKNILKISKMRKANNRALAIDPNYAQALMVKAKFMSELPGIFGGSDAEAEKHLRQSIQADPTYTTSYIELAALLTKQKRYKEAKEFLTKLLADDFPKPCDLIWSAYDGPHAQRLMREIETAM